MTSHLTVSVELISFMKWVLKHKKSELSSLVSLAIRDGLKEKINDAARVAQHVPPEELYKVVNTFLGFIEDEITGHLAKSFFHSDRNTKPYPKTLEALEPIDDSSLYKSLTPVTQAHLHAAAGSEQILSNSIHEAAEQLNEHSEYQSDQEKRRAILKAVLNNWSPETSNEVN